MEVRSVIQRIAVDRGPGVSRPEEAPPNREVVRLVTAKTLLNSIQEHCRLRSFTGYRCITWV